MHMKQKISVIIALTIILLCICSCWKNEISIDNDESFYSDFKIEDDKVYIYCNVLVKNPGNDNEKISLSGVFENDKKSGLLKKELLNGYSDDCETTEFNLKRGDNQIEVVFIGDYAGTNQKYDRLLPRIIINELHQS